MFVGQGFGKGEDYCFSGLFIHLVVLMPNLKNKGWFSLLESD